MGNKPPKGGKAKGEATSSPGTDEGGKTKSPRENSYELLERLMRGIKENKESTSLSEEFEKTWSAYDKDNNGHLDTEEGTRFVKDFMNVLAKAKGTTYKELIKDLAADPADPSIRRTEDEIIRLFFNLVDSDDDGTISRKEFEEYLNSNIVAD